MKGERERERKGEKIATMARAGPDQTYQLVLGLIHGCRNPSNWDILYCFPKYIKQKLD